MEGVNPWDPLLCYQYRSTTNSTITSSTLIISAFYAVNEKAA